VGNIPTEAVIETLRELGAEVPIRKPLDNVLKISQLIAMGSASPQLQ
jgi:hypothetical protein